MLIISFILTAQRIVPGIGTFGYKNWAALDDLGKKTDPITLKHYGTREKAQEATDKRLQLMEVVSSRIIREITLNPLP